MRLQPFQRPNPIAAALQGLTQIVQQQNQAKTQEYLLRRQMQQEQYERQRQAMLDAQRNEDRLYDRQRTETLDRQRAEQLEKAPTQQFGEIFGRELLTRENPERGFAALQELLAGRQPAPVNGFQYRPPAGGAARTPTIGGFPTSVQAEPPHVAALRNNRPMALVQQEQREAAAERKAAADRELRKQMADQRVAAMLQTAGIRGDTATRALAAKIFLEAWEATGRGDYADQVTQAFLERRQGEAATTPFPEAVQTPTMRREDTRAAAADSSAAYRTGRLQDFDLDRSLREKLGMGGLNVRKDANRIREKAVDQTGRIQQGNLSERTRHNQALELHNAETRARLSKPTAQGGAKLSRPDEIELIRIREQVGRLEKEINTNRPLAQQKDPAAMERLVRGETGLNNLLKREAEILNKYRGGSTGPDPKRPIRLKHVQQFRERYGREPSAKEVNDIADAVRRGLLK